MTSVSYANNSKNTSLPMGQDTPPLGLEAGTDTSPQLVTRTHIKLFGLGRLGSASWELDMTLHNNKEQIANKN